MIEKLERFKSGVTNTQELIDKINEIVDHLNRVHGKNQVHLDLSPIEWNKYGCGVSVETVTKEEADLPYENR